MVQCAPESLDTAQPMFDAPPSSNRPTWKVLTTVDPNEKLSGSTSVAWWLGPAVYGSVLSRTGGSAASAGPAATAAAQTTVAASERVGSRKSRG